MLTTVRNADLILVLKDGELVEQGRYAELVEQRRLFAELGASGKFVPDAREQPTAEEAEGHRRLNPRDYRGLAAALKKQMRTIIICT